MLVLREHAEKELEKSSKSHAKLAKRKPWHGREHGQRLNGP
jgi:hypothetical protein